jgi:hypothetical protein
MVDGTRERRVRVREKERGIDHARAVGVCGGVIMWSRRKKKVDNSKKRGRREKDEQELDQERKLTDP